MISVSCLHHYHLTLQTPSPRRALLLTNPLSLWIVPNSHHYEITVGTATARPAFTLCIDYFHESIAENGIIACMGLSNFYGCLYTSLKELWKFGN